MTGKRKRMKATERESNLIDSAIEVFAISNYRIATVADIAARAGVTGPLIYRHFENKRNLFLSALQRICADMLQGWRDAVAGSENPRDALRRISAFHYNFVKHQKSRAKLLFQAISEVDDRDAKKILRNHFQDCVDVLKELIGGCKESGLIRMNVDEDMAAWVLISLGIGTGFMSLFGFEEALERRRPINTFDFLLDSFA